MAKAARRPAPQGNPAKGKPPPQPQVRFRPAHAPNYEGSSPGGIDLDDRTLQMVPALVQELGWEGAALLSALHETADLWGQGQVIPEVLAGRLSKMMDPEQWRPHLHRLRAMQVVSMRAVGQSWRYRIEPDWLQMLPANAAAADALATSQRQLPQPMHMASDWTPPRATLAQLAQLGVTEQFARQELVKFREYWIGRGGMHRDFPLRFVRSVVHSWRLQQAYEARKTLEEDWRPNDTTCEQLEAEGLTRREQREALAAFADANGSNFRREADWNGAFYDFALDWKRKKGEPLPKNFRISRKVALKLAVPKETLDRLREQFVHEHADGGQCARNWDTSFYNWARYQLLLEGQSPNRLEPPVQ